ncbi:MAG: sigma-70 family RNA polymerase sigma factor [Hyphomicrobiales bacterium]|nr:sigma-70 family RNA polymerase sigma factor [Hyphomicrobiales bacterium]
MTALQSRMTSRHDTSADIRDAGRIVLADLLMRVGQHDDQALQRLYALTSGKLNGVIIAVVRQAALAEEVLQDTYMNVWKQASSYDPLKSAPMTWLAVIARNRAIDRLRSERSRSGLLVPLDDFEVDDGSTPVIDQIITGQDHYRLHGCLGSIEHDQQRMIRAAFFDGFTYDELATREGLPLSTVKSRIRRGLMKLRACMDGT